MNAFRELFYEEKPSRDDFGINENDSLNQLIYNKWLLTRKELNPFDAGYYSKITKVFNDAYFFCTTALMNRSKELNLSFFGEKFSFSSVVYPLACFYLSKLSKREQNTDRVITLLEGNIFKAHPEWGANYEEIKEIGNNYKKDIDNSLFRTRKTTPEFLSEISWYKLTRRYNVEDIKKLVLYVAKDGEERKMMAQAIYEAITETEFWSENDIYYDDEGNEYQDILSFPHAKQICQDIISDNGAALLSEHQENDNGTSPKDGDNNDFAIRKSLKGLLRSKWFDEYSTDSEKYSVEWRDKLVDDLIQSEHRAALLSDWMKQTGKNVYGRRPTVKFAFVGALIDVGVLNCKKNELAPQLNTNGKQNNDTVASYMSKKRSQPYLNWLKDYVNNDTGDPQSPFID